MTQSSDTNLLFCSIVVPSKTLILYITSDKTSL